MQVKINGNLFISEKSQNLDELLKEYFHSYNPQLWIVWVNGVKIDISLRKAQIVTTSDEIRLLNQSSI